MNKKIISIIIIVLVVISAGTIIYGAFERIKSIVGTASSGEIASSTIQLSNYDSSTDTSNEISQNALGYENGVLLCYASHREVYNVDEYVELKNLEVNVSLNSKNQVRLRIKIQDAWTSYKVYTSGTKKHDIISKDVNQNMFNFDNNWEYDEKTGYAYYQGIIESGKTENLSVIKHGTFEKDLGNIGYGYRETIFVSLGFQVDVVQANRAEEIWNVTFNN